MRSAFTDYLERLDESPCAPELVPGAAQSALRAKYPEAAVGGWIRLHSERYGAFFLDKIWYKYAQFTDEGEWISTRIFSRSIDARTEAARHIAAVLRKDFRIVAVEILLEADGRRTRDVIVEMKNSAGRCVFDQDWNLIGKYGIRMEDLPTEEGLIMENAGSDGDSREISTADLSISPDEEGDEDGEDDDDYRVAVA